MKNFSPKAVEKITWVKAERIERLAKDLSQLRTSPLIHTVALHRVGHPQLAAERAPVEAREHGDREDDRAPDAQLQCAQRTGGRVSIDGYCRFAEWRDRSSADR